MLTKDDWKIQYYEETRNRMHYWSEMHILQKSNTERRIVLRKNKNDYIGEEIVRDFPYSIWLYGNNGEEDSEGEVRDIFLKKIPSKLKKSILPHGIFVGFEYLDEAIEFIEFVKEQIESGKI